VAVGKITKSVVDKLQPNTQIWDTALNGFGVRLQTKVPHYLVRYRFNGRQRFVTIGKHGPFTVETARREAQRLLGVVAGGIDPQAAKAKATAALGETFGATIDRYLAHKVRVIRAKSFAEIERHLRRQSAPLHPMPLAQINRRNVATLLGQIEVDSGAATRNRVRSSLSAFFAWAIAEGLLDANPVTAAKATENGSRERVLSADEIQRLWAGLGDDPFSNAVRLLLLTGQRRNEIGKLRWEEIVGDSIVLPAARTKNGREHTVPLSRQAQAIIGAIPHRNSTPFLFSEAEGYANWDKARGRLDRRIEIAPWTLHDLRRTAATGMAELGVQPHIVEAVLNHVSGHKAGVAGVYNRARYEGEMRSALQRWADHIDQITK
jgi:integrase